MRRDGRRAVGIPLINWHRRCSLILLLIPLLLPLLLIVLQRERVISHSPPRPPAFGAKIAQPRIFLKARAIFPIVSRALASPAMIYSRGETGEERISEREGEIRFI